MCPLYTFYVPDFKVPTFNSDAACHFESLYALRLILTCRFTTTIIYKFMKLRASKS